MLQFGNYRSLCSTAPLTVCPYLDNKLGLDPICYARSMTIGDNDTVFEIAALIVYVLTLPLCLFMIYSIKTKYTAIGRREMVIFFYIYMLQVICEFLLISGIIPTLSSVYPYAAAAHIGLITACCWSLFLNGFVGFQFFEDGTFSSLWGIRLSSLLVFLGSGFTALATFLEIGGLKHNTTLPLFIIHFVFNGILLLIYFLMQIMLVFKLLEDKWPLGSIILGAFFFIAGQVLLLQFSSVLCARFDHYFDGLFFEALCTMTATMMIYKYYDSITMEDLEFFVGGKPNKWEVKELLEDEV